MTESRCGCLVCLPPDGCTGAAEHTAVGDEATVELCTPCYTEHRDAALAIIEADL
jgi:hypothetical protein